MTYQEINETIERIAEQAGCESTYRQWPKDSAPSPPYILFYFTDSKNIYADDNAFCKIETLNIELYTDNKEPKTEMMLEKGMKDAGMNCSKSEMYIQSEEMYEVLYETEVLIDGE